MLAELADMLFSTLGVRADNGVVRLLTAPLVFAWTLFAAVAARALAWRNLRILLPLAKSI
jgi:hypothetical protein